MGHVHVGRRRGWPAPFSGCPQPGPTDLPSFVGRIDCSLKGVAVGHGPDGNAGHLFLCAARDDGGRQRPVPAGRHHGVVSTAHRRVDTTSVNDAFRGEIAWTNVKVMPGARAQFRVEREQESLLRRARDRRGAATGRIRTRALSVLSRRRADSAADCRDGDAPNGQIVVSHTRGDALGDIILFENRDGATAYTAQHTSAARAAFNALEPEGEGAVAADTAAEDARRARPVSTRSEGDGRQLARLVVRAGHAALLHRLGRSRRCDASASDRSAACRSEARFRGRLEIATPATLSEVRVALETGDRAEAGAVRTFSRADRQAAVVGPSGRARGVEQRIRCSPGWIGRTAAM